MSIDENFRRLNEGENWSGLELIPRRVEPRRRRSPLLLQVAGVGVVGIAVGVAVTLGVGGIRNNSVAVQPSPTPTVAAVEYSQVAGVTTALAIVDPPAEGFYAEWGHNHESFTIVTWGSSSCPLIPTKLQSDTTAMTITFGLEPVPDDGDLHGCTADLAPTSTVFPTPAGVDRTRPVDLTVIIDGEAHQKLLSFEPTDIACVASMMSARVSASTIVDGKQFQDLVLTNDSGESCNMGGPLTLTFDTGQSFEYEPPVNDASGLYNLPPDAVRVYRVGLDMNTDPCTSEQATSLRVETAGGTEIATVDWHLETCADSDIQRFTITGPTADRTVFVDGWQD